MKQIRLLLLVLCLAFVALARADPIDATVRLSVSGRTMGSGTVCHVDSQHAWVLTCKHVVDKYDRISLEFWNSGWKAENVVVGQVVARGSETDSALIRVRLGGYRPPSVPFVGQP